MAFVWSTLYHLLQDAAYIIYGVFVLQNQSCINSNWLYWHLNILIVMITLHGITLFSILSNFYNLFNSLLFFMTVILHLAYFLCINLIYLILQFTLYNCDVNSFFVIGIVLWIISWAEGIYFIILCSDQEFNDYFLHTIHINLLIDAIRFGNPLDEILKDNFITRNIFTSLNKQGYCPVYIALLVGNIDALEKMVDYMKRKNLPLGTFDYETLGEMALIVECPSISLTTEKTIDYLAHFYTPESINELLTLVNNS